MYKIVRAEELTTNIYLFEVEAKRVAKACLPGQFVIVRTGEDGERIPLTISDYNREKGTITIVVQTIGAGTNEMRDLKAGDFFHDFVGPLGQPSEFCKEDIEELKKKKIIFVAGGLGTAPVYPQVKWLHEQGVLADVIIGAKNKDLLIYEEEMKKVAAESYRVLKADNFSAVLMGDTRQKGCMIPMSFDVMRIFEDAGFKLKELIIKEQHNCRATGYWKTNSVKYNFLLIAHEYLFVFRK